MHLHWMFQLSVPTRKHPKRRKNQRQSKRDRNSSVRKALETPPRRRIAVHPMPVKALRMQENDHSEKTILQATNHLPATKTMTVSSRPC